MQEMQEVRLRSLGQENPLEEAMATHSSMPAWEIPWTEETGGLQSRGLTEESETTEHTHNGLFTLLPHLPTHLYSIK